MNILLLEDDDEISKRLMITFESNGWTVKWVQAISELQGVLEAKSFYPQIVVLDRIIAGQDSANFVERIKKQFIDTKILVLSAIDTSNEKARLLDLGADDYVAKPYSSSELVARIKALGRRSMLVSSSDILKVGRLEINMATRQVEVQGELVNLSQKEFSLLSLFANHPGKVFPKEVLLEKIWNTKADVESKVVEATVNNLRRKLETHRSGSEIKNVRNVGYWLEA
ncbi:response regulator transcription factor [Bdellovibrio bacteriovorus]|uniref:response regulator transcription factor n=1 Tax=Bdellovibrio bacteriovorus TaxID=959 RepID=UPI0021D2D1B6|nr:response regulator transcription factor [Bdellovibrio bacteriovorus]UXR63388.1 response regulator transcription factor [Bdellovibrio bacteriovorus]